MDRVQTSIQARVNCIFKYQNRFYFRHIVLPMLQYLLCLLSLSLHLLDSTHDSIASSYLNSIKIPEELLIPTNRTHSRVYKLFHNSSVKKKFHKRFTSSKALMKRKFRNATQHMVHNIKRILIPKYRNYRFNVSAVMERNIDPILICVNRKSGGHRGSLILTKINQLLNEYQVCDMNAYHIKTYLQLYKDFPSLKILCCGGDGSIQWIMNECYDQHMENISYHILPLGTGNGKN